MRKWDKPKRNDQYEQSIPKPSEDFGSILSASSGSLSLDSMEDLFVIVCPLFFPIQFSHSILLFSICSSDFLCPVFSLLGDYSASFMRHQSPYTTKQQSHWIKDYHSCPIMLITSHYSCLLDPHVAVIWITNTPILAPFFLCLSSIAFLPLPLGLE